MGRSDAPDPADEGSAADSAGRQDPIVGRLRPDPAQPPEPTLTLTGFLGDSDRSGFRRLYFTRSLDYYAEFRADDVVHTVQIPASEQPFVGEEATSVALRREAMVEYTRTRTARPPDDFDLDVRLGGRRQFRVRDRGYTGREWTGCDYHTCATQCPTGCATPTDCATECDTLCWTKCGPCLLPYTVKDPTCDRTCQGASCDTGCCPIDPPHPSLIETACEGPCEHRPFRG